MCILKGGSGSRWVDHLRVGVGYRVWGFRIEKKSPDFRSPEVGISATTLPLEQTLRDPQSCCSCSASSSQTMNSVQGRI